MWHARHRVLLAVLLVQGLALGTWLGFAGFTVDHAFGHVALIGGSAAIALTRAPQRLRASAMALGLFSESMLFVHLSHGNTTVHFHFFVMLCLLALYEDPVPFFAGVAYVVVQHGVIGTLVPDEVYDDAGERAHPWVWAGIHGAFVLAASGALVGTWRANAAVRASDSRHRRTAEAYLAIADVMLVALDEQGRVQMVNRTACETLGRVESELLGHDWLMSAVAPEDREAARAGATEYRVRRADGQRRLTQWRVVETASPAGTLASGTDITERRAAELELAREQEELTGLRRLAQAVAGEDDARGAVVREIALLSGASFASLGELRDGGTRLEVTAATLDRIAGQSVSLQDEASGSGIAIATGEPFFVADAAGHPAVHSRSQGLVGAHSYLFQPVMVGGRPAAVLVVGWADKVERLGTRQTDLVALAADEAASALQRLAALQRLEAEALADGLTGVPNRRAFDAELPKALARARRSGAPLTLMMFDLNGFKQLNDRDGHEAGDRLLQAVARAWTAELRETDQLARLGGDEFAAILPDCGHDDALAVAERLRAEVQHGPGAGVGLAVWDGEEEHASLMRRADAALYADKALARRKRLSDPERLAALAATGLLQGGPTDGLDELSRNASWLLQVPMVAVTLVGTDEQVFAGQCGITGWAAERGGTPIAYSVCQHVVAGGRPLVIDDLRLDPLTAETPAVEELGVLAYAGMPLIDGAGNRLGALCALDEKPRAWTESEVVLLRRLAERAVAEIEAKSLPVAAAR